LLALFFAQHRHRILVQRDTDRFATFGFVGMNPRRATLEIDIHPL